MSQQQGPSSGSSSGLPATTSATSSPAQPGSPSVGKKRHSSKASSRTAKEKKTHGCIKRKKYDLQFNQPANKCSVLSVRQYQTTAEHAEAPPTGFRQQHLNDFFYFYPPQTAEAAKTQSHPVSGEIQVWQAKTAAILNLETETESSDAFKCPQCLFTLSFFFPSAASDPLRQAARQPDRPRPAGPEPCPERQQRLF